MYARFVLTVQVILLLLASNASAHVLMLREGGRSESSVEVTSVYKVVSDQALQGYVKQNIDQIEAAVVKLTDPVQKLHFIHARVSRVAQFRSTNWSKSAFLEQQLDLDIKPFESFPQPQEFKKDRCSQYENQISVEWEPQSAETKTIQSGVARALRVLKEICT